mmetsp:Transcript_27523/g.40301  ORF Transcript_27523/g.40301 Transcript_27523/m.40301 type:complete len:119 (+) Transcript_27523:1187-1543(+)
MGLITTLLSPLLTVSISFNLLVLVNNAENDRTNPILNNHGTLWHAALKTSSLISNATKLSGMNEEVRMKVPIHNIYKKNGCDARTTFVFLRLYVHTPQAIDSASRTMQKDMQRTAPTV